MSHLLIAVIGPAQSSPSETQAAETVGRVLAEGGATVICGGRGGVMEAVCRGAHLGEGLTVGVLPGTTLSEANPHVDVAIATGLGEARNAIVARAGKVVVAIGGRFGTLSEIALALKLGIPVVGLQTWRGESVVASLSTIIHVDDPVEAAHRALALARAV